MSLFVGDRFPNKMIQTLEIVVTNFVDHTLSVDLDYRNNPQTFADEKSSSAKTFKSRLNFFDFLVLSP
ncbi:MAG: hypothetical protein DI539_28935 [Flavobacterium psychrophilum]|nr:MAG: hypothetical protein DI539_28935 [Flavobacterium psychrophilum]